MNSEFKISVPDEFHEKLKKLANLLNISLQELTRLAFKEFFELIRNDPEIFLDDFGLIDKLKDIID
ncbi:MAG: hypothetical protein EU535_08600 [Promethearchaeota archaeon]|nr:MAG: hypothetical protein EU535_08600 [Candidatus Lokiarchaeota archaeon]